MKQSTRNVRLQRCAFAASVLLLGACGGGGSGYEVDATTPPPVAVIPDSALVSGTAYADYARTLSNSETDAPVDISKVNIPPTSETVDPVTL